MIPYWLILSFSANFCTLCLCLHSVDGELDKIRNQAMVFVRFFKLYISELHLDDVYEDFEFDKTRWNDRNGCFESQTEGVGGRDNNSIIIIITFVNIMVVIMIILITITIIIDLRLRPAEMTATGCCESHFSNETLEYDIAKPSDHQSHHQRALALEV